MKKAIITLELIQEAGKASNQELEEEILDELTSELPRIPWQGRIIRVKVLDD